MLWELLLGSSFIPAVGRSQGFTVYLMPLYPSPTALIRWQKKETEYESVILLIMHSESMMVTQDEREWGRMPGKDGECRMMVRDEHEQRDRTPVRRHYLISRDPSVSHCHPLIPSGSREPRKGRDGRGCSENDEWCGVVLTRVTRGECRE